jgi:hypothetical protein
MEAVFFVIGAVAYISGLVLPVAAARYIWRQSARPGRAWGHALCLPVLLAGEYALIWIVFWAAHDDGEGPPGLGLAVIPIVLLTAASLLAYYLALAWRLFRRALA